MQRPLTIFVPHASDCLTDHMPHGDGLVAYGFVRELARRGHRIHALTPMVALAETPSPNIVVHNISYDPKRSGLERLRYIGKTRQIYATVRRHERVDIVHQLNPVSMALGLGMTGVSAPVVIGNYIANWDHDADLREASIENSKASPAKRVKILGRHAIQLLQQCMAQRILLTTSSAKSRLVAPESFRAKIRYIHHGIDTERFMPVESGYYEPQEPTILFLTNLLVRKGIYTLLEAFSLVRAHIPNAKLVIGGTGRDFEAVRACVSQHSQCDGISLLGNIERNDIPQRMNDATVYCLPSHGEPYGMTAVEAMACAKPVVVTNASGLGEITPLSGGRSVPPRDAASLAAALIDILSLSRDQREAMGRENRRYAEATFGWKNVVDALEDVYSELLSGQKN